jgi:hypothetical protein
MYDNNTVVYCANMVQNYTYLSKEKGGWVRLKTQLSWFCILLPIVTTCFGLARPFSGHNVVHKGLVLYFIADCDYMFRPLSAIFRSHCRTLRPEDGRARPKHVVTIVNKIQNQDSCVFRRTPPTFFLFT